MLSRHSTPDRSLLYVTIPFLKLEKIKILYLFVNLGFKQDFELGLVIKDFLYRMKHKS